MVQSIVATQSTEEPYFEKTSRDEELEKRPSHLTFNQDAIYGS